ncbi:MAG: transcriptional repressor [Alphaproteobacteria bacterium]|nr:transcriptional repressor [Alphaproteobacteria bacterium]
MTIANKRGPLSELEKKCLEKGIKLTEQRRIIVKVLSDATDHPDVEEVHRRASAINPKLNSIATVYRTLRTLEDEGIIDRHDFGDGRSRYETVQDGHHDHLIDIRSGTVLEFYNEEIERLKERIAYDLGFRLVDHRLELYAVPLLESEKKK